MLIIIMNMISFTFMFLKHPLSMGITIILQTINVALITGMMMGSFMMSYIIVIIMLSGMLVLFIYMASIASNEMFKLSLKIIFISMMMLLMFMSQENLNIELNKNHMNMSKMLLIMFNNKNMIIMLVMYLLLAMITVSMIVNITEGPLRTSK
uniref:NADH dehydrogenase subunit 6 n=2 Tax=Physopelta TaxID=209985 RepID=B7SML5_9HEMI|nr:NADH dehydrogenase subunit 6 [Physopelta gutta]YP_009643425.1 NADH dehydrogenase subunit 6 [Physopelta cincticollis]ABZ02109.1 NADH dehydrogenase subunit 6 [Physopelta gutta]APO08855.1 NADH dehydrogenase subunit 6 [Physopelta cincticollis]